MSETSWWQPDEGIVDAVIQRRVGFRRLDEATLSWVVAALSELGMSTKEIGESLGCSQRHVKRVRALVLTQQMRRVCRLQHEAEHADRLRGEAVAYARDLEVQLEQAAKRVSR